MTAPKRIRWIYPGNGEAPGLGGQWAKLLQKKLLFNFFQHFQKSGPIAPGLEIKTPLRPIFNGDHDTQPPGPDLYFVLCAAKYKTQFWPRAGHG
jgi:hypothetical protein